MGMGGLAAGRLLGRLLRAEGLNRGSKYEPGMLKQISSKISVGEVSTG